MQPNQLPQVPDNLATPDSNSQFNVPYQRPIPTEPKQKGHIIRYLQERRIFILVTLLILIPTVFVVLVYKYDIFGVVKKQNYSVLVVDGQTHQPLSNAKVSMRGVTVTTNSKGQATFPRIKIGDGILTITHAYYQDYKTPTLITFTNNAYHVFGLKNIGTEVSIFVNNRITQKPISGAIVSALQTSVRTNSIGHAIMNLPSNQYMVDAKIVANTYNDAEVNIDTQNINAYTVVPSGKVYYLAKTNPVVSLVQSNTDGSSPVTVLPGSSNSTPANSQVITSHDARYVAVVTPDASNMPTLYVYNSLKNTFKSIGQSALGINLDGWTPDDILVYTTVANGTPDDGGSGSNIIAYNAASNSPQSYRLDTGNVGGFNSYTASQQNYNSVIVLNDDSVLFSKYWTGMPSTISSNSTSISSILATSNKLIQEPSSVKSLTPTTSYAEPPQVVYTSPTTADIAYTNSTNNKLSYFTFSKGKISPSTASAISATIANPPVSTPYILSPLGANQLWSRVSGGKTTVYTGDVNGLNPKAIANFDNTDYIPYGWWTNDYILLSYKNNNLYIMPASGSNNQNKVQNIAIFIP